ncbi:hypothetical protein DRQ36_00530 [bacterium]|nr:MAG: hypothetical protein DRQ36_00530 [bacterium]
MEKKCQACKKNPAEVRCVIMVDGERVVRYLCVECARTAGFKEQSRMSRKKTRKLLELGFEKANPVCPECRLGFSQFLKTGLLGCPVCYSAFDKQLADILKGLHSTSFHRGRGPGKEREFDIAQLKWKLFGAVEAEDFEKAAELRDEIRRIEKDNN